MQAITRLLKSPISATVFFVLANILWVISVLTFLGPQVGTMFGSIRTETPVVPLRKLECPFMLNRDGQGMVVATVANPYETIHGYSVSFEVGAYRSEFWQEDRDYEDRQNDYQEYRACTQQIRIPPKQTAKTSCVVNRPEIETDSINVTVYAYSDKDRARGMVLTSYYESSYKSSCLIQSGRMSVSPTMIQALLASVCVLLAIGWVFAMWQYIGPVNQVILSIAGFLVFLAWGFIAWLLASINGYMLLLFLLTTGSAIALTLWITRRIQKWQPNAAEHRQEYNKDKNQ